MISYQKNIKPFGLKLKKLDALSVVDDRYIKTKIRTYGDNVYANFRALHLSENDVEYESFTVISIDFLLVYESKYYLKLYLDNCPYKIVDKQMIYYPDDNLFDT